MTKKKIMLKAETHYGKIELPMTQAKALSFSKKLLATHKREKKKYTGECWIKTTWGKRRVYRNEAIPKNMVEPYLKLEFIEIEA
jgi:hypothetical protein